MFCSPTRAEKVKKTKENRTDSYSTFNFYKQNPMQKVNKNNNDNGNYDNNDEDNYNEDNDDDHNFIGSYRKMSAVLTDNTDGPYISGEPMNVHGFTSDLSVIKEVRTCETFEVYKFTFILICFFIFIYFPLFQYIKHIFFIFKYDYHLIALYRY